MLGAAVLLTLVAFVLRIAESILTMDYYLDPAYSAVWSKLMMPAAGPPPAQFFFVSLLFGLITSLIIVWAYHVVAPILAGQGWIKKGVFFGLFLFLLASAPGIMSMMLLINLPAALLFAWLVAGFVISMVDGLILAKLC
jgi:hypothetical protein